jgi:predicted transcriptional regulator
MNLKQFRRVNDLTQYELADIMGFSRGYVQTVERGQNDPSDFFKRCFGSITQKDIDRVKSKNPERLGYAHVKDKK